MDTLELANDYVNMEWEDFSCQAWRESCKPEVLGIIWMRTRAHRALWKGVPISRDGKVRLRDGTYG